ncbi:MAG: Rrf2 family transcriptional regulator [Proteobacteria bacterium]|nr:Rrf2 family transcriptional regulator [Pseudomonadota bacterium]
MRLSTKGRYAVMAMADLASHGGIGPVSLAEIADRQEISLSYLEQLFGKLRRAGQVKSVRGPGGGYMLAFPADQTRIADIVLAVDEPIRATRCRPGSPLGCRGDKGRCLTHDLWEELGNHIYLFLSAVTLAHVVERRVLGMSRLTRREPAIQIPGGNGGHAGEEPEAPVRPGGIADVVLTP